MTAHNPADLEHRAATADAHAIGAVTGLQTALDARRGMATGLRYLLDAGYSTAIQVCGDSTGNETSEWVYLLASALAADYPGHTVRYRLFSDAAQDYATPVTIQTGPDGLRHAVFPSGDGNYLTTPDTADNSVTGDIDIRWFGVFDAAPTPSFTSIVSKWELSGNRSFNFYFHSTGALRLDWTADGSTVKYQISTAVPTITVGTPIGLRVTLNTTTGQGTFYTSDDGYTWTQFGGLPTPAGATSVFDSTFLIQVGANNALVGRVYEVDVRSGIGGPSVVPRNIDAWTATASVTFAGSPTLDIVNGSIAGANLAYLNASDTRLRSMIPPFGQSVFVVSDSHNESTSIGQTFLAALKTYIDAVRARIPDAGVFVTMQNPQTAPSAYNTRRWHDLRLGVVGPWAAMQGYRVIDAAHALVGRAGMVSEADGVHPTAAGSAVWADVAHEVLTEGV